MIALFIDIFCGSTWGTIDEDDRLFRTPLLGFFKVLDNNQARTVVP